MRRLSLRKKVVHDQLRVWIEFMSVRPEWATVQRHLMRAMAAVEQMMREK